MSGANYILGLLEIITGLAISDMIVSLHGLLINRRKGKMGTGCLFVPAALASSLPNQKAPLGKKPF